MQKFNFPAVEHKGSGEQQVQVAGPVKEGQPGSQGQGPCGQCLLTNALCFKAQFSTVRPAVA